MHSTLESSALKLHLSGRSSSSTPTSPSASGRSIHSFSLASTPASATSLHYQRAPMENLEPLTQSRRSNYANGSRASGMGNGNGGDGHSTVAHHYLQTPSSSSSSLSMSQPFISPCSLTSFSAVGSSPHSVSQSLIASASAHSTPHSTPPHSPHTAPLSLGNGNGRMHASISSHANNGQVHGNYSSHSQSHAHTPLTVKSEFGVNSSSYAQQSQTPMDDQPLPPPPPYAHASFNTSMQCVDGDEMTPPSNLHVPSAVPLPLSSNSAPSTARDRTSWQTFINMQQQ